MIEQMSESLKHLASQAEVLIADTASKLVPLLTPLPTAYAVASTAREQLDWPGWVCVSIAISIEAMGIATVNTAMELREYNATKRSSDPAAPFGLAVALAVGYLVVAVVLAVVMDVFPVLAVYSPAIFPFLSLAGATVLAVRADHRRRAGAIAGEKAERNERRMHKKNVQQPHSSDAQRTHSADGRNALGNAQNAALDVANRTKAARKAVRLSALLDAYEDNPEIGVTEAGHLIGVHRNTIYNYTAELERDGKLAKNGNGWKVLK